MSIKSDIRAIDAARRDLAGTDRMHNRAPLDVLARAARSAPDGTLFVMAQPVTPLRSGRLQTTLHAFTPDGIRSRTLESRVPWGGPDDSWTPLHAWGGGPIPWSAPYPYDGDTPQKLRAWHEHEHGWYVVPT